MYLLHNPAHRITVNIKRETVAFTNFFSTLTVCKKYPERHPTQYDIHVLRELMNTAEFLMGTPTGDYIKRNQEDSTKSIQLGYRFSLVVPVTFVNSFFQVPLLFTASGASSFSPYEWWCP